ncbi:hypothetical protein MBANPS3_012273, partial [Mucor bainieri]
MTEELSFIRDSLTQMLENDRQEDELIKVRQNFDSINDIRQAAIRYARRHKFAVSTLRSGARQLVLVCKHSGVYRATKSKTGTSNDPQSATPEEATKEAQASPAADSPAAAAADAAATTVADAAADPSPGSPESSSKKNTRKKLSQKILCPFEIRAKPMGTSWIIYKVNYEHNHEMATDIKAYAQHRKLSSETKQLIIDLMRSGSTNSAIMEYLQLKGIDNVLKKDIANIRQAHFNSKSKKGNPMQKPQQFLFVKVPSSSPADSSGTFQATLPTNTEEHKPAQSSCVSTRRAVAAAAAAAAANAATNATETADDKMEISTSATTVDANMTTDTTTQQPQPQQKNESTTAEGEQPYQFVSQNNNVQ